MEEYVSGLRLTNQRAVLFEWTNQKAIFGPRDFFARDRFFGGLDPSFLGSSMRGQAVTSAEMATETGSEVKTHFIQH